MRDNDFQLISLEADIAAYQQAIEDAENALEAAERELEEELSRRLDMEESEQN